MNNYKIQIKELNDSVAIQSYKDLLTKKWGNNVYYSIEHIRYFGKETDQLKCFLLEKDNVPIILMPFVLREIKINEVDYPYYDVISPYGYNGPLFNDDVTSEDLSEFWRLVDIWYKENNVISEFIRFSLNSNHENYSGTLIKTLSNVKGGLLDQFEDQWNAFLPKVRNNYRKAINYDLTFKVFHKKEINKDIIKIFHSIYEDTMTRNNADKIYFFSNKYFEDLILSNLNNFSIVVVYYKEIPISVELIINYNDIIFAFLGGTNAEYFSYRPNDFLRVKVIEWAINNGKKYYVLGGGMKDGDGLYKNKKSLFPKDEDVMFYTGRKVINKEVYSELCLSSSKEYADLDKEDLDKYFFPYYRLNNR
ncbi:GNAT family N-acetyltransferase [Aquimarina litoralis]|uniref:GNAT family N-acetyltransferase n=1 Tax=Aquimarina litoralis TaxID=584605 RepID=UPI001C57DAF8|nr:GNAT family N-acetyltransferase [Aquimarina litoralis]MBW1296531.1 GNAT family N-acetyltransferase [Aquimarina litoralis]